MIDIIATIATFAFMIVGFWVNCCKMAGRDINGSIGW